MIRILCRILAVCGILLVSFSGNASAAGEWFWRIATNPHTGTLHYSGHAGSASPLVLSATLYNNDPANLLSCDGITLKTDDLAPNDPSLFDSLWSTDSAVMFPDSYKLTGSSSKVIKLGQFNLASAMPGTYSFRLIAAGRYDNLDQYKPELISDVITIDVFPVPEPSALLGLGSLLAPYVLVRRRFK